MQTVAVGWQLYEQTGSALALGGVGLVQVLPLILLALPAGHVADRYPRRHVAMLAEVLLALGAVCLALISITNTRQVTIPGGITIIYGCLLASGVARAFAGPAKSAMLPQIVSHDAFPNAVTWNSGCFQLASVLGPALGGLLIAQLGSATFVYVANAAASLVFLGLLTTINPRHVERSKEQVTFETLAAGVRYVWSTRLILAAITLDMFAVLLGGATTLLPIYAKDVLHADAGGLGWLYAASPAGAVVMVLVLAFRPPMQRAGRALLLAVASFGVWTIVFGLSRSFAISLVALFLLGASDQISVVIRSTLLQVRTPDELRGRVAAVNSLFVGTSNELGGFESGFVAALVGPVATVVGGGFGTLVIAFAIALMFPEVRRLTSIKPNIKPANE